MYTETKERGREKGVNLDGLHLGEIALLLKTFAIRNKTFSVNCHR